MWPKRPVLAFPGPGDEEPGQGQGGIGMRYLVPGQNSSSRWGGNRHKAGACCSAEELRTRIPAKQMSPAL